MKIEKDKITFTPTEKVEVMATEKHPGGKGPRKVPAHMVEHLASKGMIEKPKKSEK